MMQMGFKEDIERCVLDAFKAVFCWLMSTEDQNQIVPRRYDRRTNGTMPGLES